MRKKRIRKKNYINKIIFIIFCVFLLGYLISIYMNIEINNYTAAKEGEYLNEKEINISENNNIEDIIEKSTKTVVGISKLQNNGITMFLEGGVEALDLGTGIIVSRDGYILTNQHIAGNKYSKCYVTIYDGREYKSNVIWANEELDLAVLKINASNLEYAKLGDSDGLRIGENVYAIGNPVGVEFQRTVTSGIISGIDRTVKLSDEQKYMEGLIQTDCAINNGNSGGPLINEKGEVVGINTIKISSAEGLGFAIPINIAKIIINRIIENKDYEQATLGILAYDREVVPYIDYNLKIDNGVYVVQVNYSGPAYNAGIREKDLITNIDEIEINKINDLREYIYNKNVGDVVNLKIKRKNKDVNIAVRLGKKY